MAGPTFRGFEVAIPMLEDLVFAPASAEHRVPLFGPML
jgi:hypothetical protein